MNNEPSTPALSDAVLVSNVFAVDDDLPANVRSKKWEQYRKKTEVKKRAEFLDCMLKSLDITIYVQISALYYMDCSLWHFILRTVIQLCFLSPNSLPNLPYLRAIFAANVLCVLTHLINAQPEAGELSRGYLHGGVLIDFVGQKGPISKFRLLAYDVFTLILQIIMLTVMTERHTLDEVATSASGGQSDSTSSQDHDSEERGIRRSDQSNISPITDDIELQDLSSAAAAAAAGRTGGEEDGERNRLLSDTAEAMTNAHNHPLDAFFAGQSVITEAYVVDMIKDSWRQYKSGASNQVTASTLRAASGGQITFPFLAGRLRARMNVGNRNPAPT